jgi:Domain of unknown function (DUF4249)
MKRVLVLFFCSFLFNSCIDRINIEVPDSYSSQLVVDGVITDEPGPYTVRLTRSVRVEKFLKLSQESVTKSNVTIFDNVGNSEGLVEKEPGVYQTKANGIQGVVGREYSIKIETAEGKVYESEPDRMNPVGEVDSLYYQFESYLPIKDQERYGFRFYADSQSPPGEDAFLRLQFTRVFEIDAYPELHTAGNCIPDARPCSGRIDTEFGLKDVGECTCCKCWVTVNENQPFVSDNQFISGGKSKKIEVGYVPLEFFPFQLGKYRVEVKQMSLTRKAYDFWRIIQSQKEGVATLFQPPTGRIRGNIYSTTGVEEVQGLFYASSVKKRQRYLTYEDFRFIFFSKIPNWGCEKAKIAESCILAFPNSSNVKPADWE